MELNWARDVKDNKKVFFKYFSRKRMTGENVGPLLNGAGALVTKDMEKTELIQSLLLRSAPRNLRHWRQDVRNTSIIFSDRVFCEAILFTIAMVGILQARAPSKSIS